MDVIELGVRLRQQREHLGLSIADVSESTCISRRILEVFEAGDLEKFPHPVYAKGFIRNYARVLGIDPEECARVVERATKDPQDLDEKSTECDLTALERNAQQVVTPSRPIWPSLLGVVMLVGILAALIWYFSFSSTQVTQETPGDAHSVVAPAQPEQTVASQAHEAEPAAGVKSQSPELFSSESETEASEALQPEELALRAPIVAQASASDTRPEPVQYIEEALPDETGKLHTLSITVNGNDPCWVGVWIPGTEDIAKDFTVPAGQSVNYRFRGQRLVRFGRIDIVQLVLDGKAHPVSGKGVVTLTLP